MAERQLNKNVPKNEDDPFFGPYEANPRQKTLELKDESRLFK